jgi:hypothetical protein
MNKLNKYVCSLGVDNRMKERMWIVWRNSLEYGLSMIRIKVEKMFEKCEGKKELKRE